MMNKSVLFLSLLSGTALLPGLVLASGFPTHTPKHTPKPEPVSFIDMAHSYKTAAVCFLGYGDCDPDTGFGSGNADYAIDTTIQCRNEGFSRQNCNSVQVIDGVCPYTFVLITHLSVRAANVRTALFPVRRDRPVSAKAAAENMPNANA